ncbi:hypothetical protein [Actinacidiphila oryziradicis]|uniref:Uncharacterized protein n=1 Tax=Actinacidiphila oryziradicis TaxID=2571141 RepID=A0A4U0S2F9_9ACTN|nr:hypothetical protein [Actinacidiphila oryziradicis]TKA01221.1 hypothetical protein FCI23_40895 [Actinacidiphila oryziradicis]
MSKLSSGADIPPEHVRFAAHLQALAQVTDDQELALVTAVLADPDQAMARSAVARHLDRRAAMLHQRREFDDWALGTAGAVAGHPFLVQRLHEWTLFSAVALGKPWTPDTLTAASDWLQRKIADCLETPEALIVLADNGRTRRVRNTATAKVNSRPS